MRICLRAPRVDDLKDRPHTPGNPAFFFNGVDDQSSTKRGESA